MSAETWNFSWDRGAAEIARIGGMIGPVTFELPNGQRVQPFAIAPWGDDAGAEHAALPEILKRLRGEWVCVPFGMPEPPPLPVGWRDDSAAPASDGAFGMHGPSSNQPWQLVRLGEGSIELALDYPESHPVKRVTRTIKGVPGQAALAFTLSIEVRRPTELPIGLHPVFRLPEGAGKARLQIVGTPLGHTYPIDVEPGVSCFLHGQQGVPLDAVPLKDGSVADATAHPLPFGTEEILLVTGSNGRASLSNSEEGYLVNLEWDPAAFPSCNLWLSNTGRSVYPWNSRHRALGIEPVAAPFDLGIDIARNPKSPLRRAGVITAQKFHPDTIWTTHYQISVEPIL